MWITKFRNANYKNFIQKIKMVAKKEDKSYIKLLLQYGYLLTTRGFAFNDYLNYRLYNKTKNQIKDYVSVKDQDKFYEIVSPSAYKGSFSIKSNFMNIFKDYVKRDFIYKDNSFDEFNDFLNNHEVIIVKPVDGLGGANISKLKTKNIKNRELFYQEMIKNNYLLEELIIQHSKMSKLCPSSVNTIRIMTSNINNKSKILFATLRIGNGKNYVDNFHQGGMAVLLDINSGKIISNATDKNLNTYDKHPTTKINFKGFEIPYFEKVKQMVLAASKVVPEINVVGWDVAISKDGPVIVEGNRRAGFDIVQVVSDKGRKDIIDSVLNKKTI